MNTILRWYYNTVMRGIMKWLYRNDSEGLQWVDFVCDQYVKCFNK